jgi:CHAT domain-containing protein
MRLADPTTRIRAVRSRFTWVALVATLLWLGTAAAQPRNVGKKPTAAQQAELDRLQKELTEHQVKQAYVKAIKVAKRLYDLQRKVSGDDSIYTWQRKQTLASMLQSAGDYAAAQTLYKEMLRDAEQQHGPDSREVLTALMPLSGIHWAQGQYAELEPIYQRMLAISKKVDGEQSQQYTTYLSLYGAMLQTKNEYSSAQRIYEQMLKIAEGLAKSKDDPSLTAPLMSLGSIYWTTNQQPKAIAAYNRAMAIAEKDPNANLLVKTSTMWGIAAQYHFGGRPDLAKPLLAKVTSLYKQEITRLEQTAPDDWQLPSLYGMLGYIHRQNGDLAAAEQAYLKAIAIMKAKSPVGFSGYESMLADIKRAQGNPKEALALLEKAAASLRLLAPKAATSFNYLIAEVHREMGNFAKAEQLLLEHHKAMEAQFGKKHPSYGASLLWLANVYMASGKLAPAEKSLAESLDIAEREVANVLKTGTESDHAVYFQRNGYHLDVAINFHLAYAPKSTSAAALALTTLLRRKGRVLDAAAANLATLRAKLSPDDKKLLDELASARAKLSKLHVAGPTATGEAEYAKEIAALEDQIHKLELQVSKKSASYRVVSQTVQLAAVQKMIPKDARLVEIVNYQPADPKAPYSLQPKLLPRRYAAFVVGRTGTVRAADLGPVDPIDTAIEKFRQAVADPDNDRAGELGNALYKLTMAKIVPLLGGSTNVLIAPDGALNVVPFSALVDNAKQFLIKKYTFTYLTSGRDLLRLAVKTKAQGGGVVFADPAFDATGAPAPAGTTRGRRSADLASLLWQPLPGTAQEADLVEKTLPGLKVYRRDQATEATVKRVRGPKILHLATHGFFLPDEPLPITPDAGERGMAGAPPGVPGGLPTPTPTIENPLLRSGLAFAGANKLRSGDEDGILTAMEASGLDLWGTKLVVLSACETGVGKVTNGDGVYGLRRALVIAGAESLVMSLWQVDDAATKDLMVGYYGKLAKGKPRSTALRDVQLELLARDQYAHPYYWASFLPAGDNSPL